MATSSTAQTTILVVAALSRELSKLASDPRLTLLETGEGVANAERRLEAWLARQRTGTVLSIGFAGALSPSLEAGDLVVARGVLGSQTAPDATLLAAARRVGMSGRAAVFGVAVTADRILWKAESKRELASSLPNDEIGFVDMESSAIARVCLRQGLPLMIVRSITDLLDEDLPLDFNLYRNCDGRVDSERVMKAALLRPRAISRLIKLRNRSELCAERMAEFVRRLVPLITEQAFDDYLH